MGESCWKSLETPSQRGATVGGWYIYLYTYKQYTTSLATLDIKWVRLLPLTWIVRGWLGKLAGKPLDQKDFGIRSFHNWWTGLDLSFPAALLCLQCPTSPNKSPRKWSGASQVYEGSGLEDPGGEGGRGWTEREMSDPLDPFNLGERDWKVLPCVRKHATAAFIVYLFFFTFLIYFFTHFVLFICQACIR